MEDKKVTPTNPDAAVDAKADDGAATPKVGLFKAAARKLGRVKYIR